MIARVYLCFLLACVLFFLCPLTSFALPSQVEADRYLLAAKQKIDDQNYSEAKRYFEKIIALEDSIAIPDKFYYHYGRVLNKTGDYDKAYQQLEIYLNGQDRTFYKEALTQITYSEEKSEQTKKQAYGVEMVSVPGGCYQMGNNSSEGPLDEKPMHEVCLDDFYIGKFEVTQALWKAVMGSNPSHYKGDKRPVESVSWFNALEFTRKLNQLTSKEYRLPTEAEWEYAARSGGKKQLFAGTNEKIELKDYAWFVDNAGKQTHPVGKKRPNGLGLYDMTGNVGEWCSDNYIYASDYYKNSPRRNPRGPVSGQFRVFRGGSWNFPAVYIGAGRRFYEVPGIHHDDVGFRLVLPADL